MLPLPSVPTNLIRRIDSWTADVERHRECIGEVPTQPQVQQLSRKSATRTIHRRCRKRPSAEESLFTSRSRHPMNLRHTSMRQPLAETSYNPRPPKRKAPAATTGANAFPRNSKIMKGPDPPQRPASPRRSKTLPRLADAAPLSHRQMSTALSSAPSLPPSESSRSGTSTKRTKSKSPTRDGKSLSQVKSLDSYTIYDLEECIPSVRMMPFEEVEPKKLHPAVAKLYKTLEKVSTKLFPDELKVSSPGSSGSSI